MPIIKIPTPLRAYADDKSELELNGQTVSEVLDALLEQHPELTDHFYDESGEPRRFINIILGENHIKDLQGLDTPLNEEDVLRIIPNIAGG